MRQAKRTLIGIVLVCLTLFIYFFFWILSSATAEQVFIGLSPFLLHAVILMFRISTTVRDMSDLMFMWLTPLILPIIFYVAWASELLPLISVMDGQSLAMWQMILSFTVSICVFILVLLSNSKRKDSGAAKAKKKAPESQTTQQHVPVQNTQPVDALAAQLTQQQHHIRNLEAQLVESGKYQQMASDYMQHNSAYAHRLQELENELRLTKQKLSINRDSVSVTLREIEAKAKALNFVVGRVYADKKGGSKDIRELLHIPRDLYNEFSQITSDYSSDDAARLLNILLILQNKLALYELPEKKMFSLEKSPQIPLERSSNGSDSIIEVLSRNDNDPVVDYYAGAKEVCTKLIAFLQSELKI